MKIERLFNHNVILTRNEIGEEIVCMGKGLAFQKKVGDEIDSEKIEKEFILKDNNSSAQFQQLLSDIPSEEIELVKEIIEIAEQELEVELVTNTYITLTDHIHYAFSRYKEGIVLPNPLLFETRKFYPKEYKVAKKVLDLIKRDFAITFADDEAGFIALHLVNGRLPNSDMESVMNATRIVQDILTIISRFFGTIFNEDTLNYQRIVTHLQFFVQRYLRNETHDEEDPFLYEMIQGKYPEAFSCVRIINDYLINTQKKSIDNSEQVYLTIHIQRVVKENTNQ